MSMTSEDWLTAVKTRFGGGLSGNTYHDEFVAQTIETVRDYLSGAGVTDEQMESPLGIGTVTLGVKDNWNPAPGGSIYSDIFRINLKTLQARSMPDVTEDNGTGYSNTGNTGEGF